MPRSRFGGNRVLPAPTLSGLAVALGFLILAPHQIRGQEGSPPFGDTVLPMPEVTVPDSLQPSPDGPPLSESDFESLVEQSEEVDESALLDLLQTETGRGEVPHQPLRVQTRSRLSQKLQRSRGFAEGRYLGSSIKSYQRLKFQQGEHIGGGIIVEKDPGESKLNDFTAGYFRVSGLGLLSAVVLGDFIVEAGQGIALWRGYDFHKGANVPVNKRARGIIPYASSDENAFLRGLAAEVRLMDFSLSGFYSRKLMSGAVDERGDVTSIYTSGYFRTEAERQKRNTFSETLIGGRIHYRPASALSLGITALRSRYSRSLSLSGERFVGYVVNVAAADYRFSLQTLQLFGEWGSSNGVVGGISGLQILPARGFNVVAAYRSYPFRFFNLHNLGFGERDGTSNEEGWYMGISFRPFRRARLSAYFDVFRFPTPSSLKVFPGEGHEAFVQVEISPVSRFSVLSRYRRKIVSEQQTKVDDDGRLLRLEDRKTTESIRLTLDYVLDGDARMRSRVEYLWLHLPVVDRREHGLLVYHDVVLRPAGRLWFNARVVVFRTDSFNSGIAEYERDLPGVVAAPILYGRGVRWYLLASYSITDSMQLGLKYSDLVREDVKTIGSGLDELPTNKDNRISVQFDLKL